jgi:hypothetical protein
MAHFYGRLHGSRGETTRCGTVASGISVSVNGWNLGIDVRMFVDEDGEDCAIVDLTGGSNSSATVKAIGVYKRSDFDRQQATSTPNPTVTEPIKPPVKSLFEGDVP